MTRHASRVVQAVATAVVVATTLSVMASVPAVASDKFRLKPPKVSANGAVWEPSYSVAGDSDGHWISVRFTVKHRGKKVPWSDGRKLSPGTYRMTATARPVRSSFVSTMSEKMIWESKSALRSGWTYRISEPVFTTEYKDVAHSEPAEVTYGQDKTRPDPPRLRYYRLEYDKYCGSYPTPHSPCYWYYDSTQRVEVSPQDPRIIAQNTIEGSSCYQRPECTQQVLTDPLGEWWAYGPYQWVDTVSTKFVVSATRTYRHLATGAVYTAAVTKRGSIAYWGTLEAFRKSIMSDDPFGFTTATRVIPPQRRVRTASVVFTVKPPPPPKPTPTDGGDRTPGTYYDNCTEARNDGAAPLYRGDPGYGPHLDRDGDGVACEY